MFIDAEIDICPGFGWVGGPVFTTRIIRLHNGQERRNANAAYPSHQYTLPIQNISGTEYLEKLKAAFMVARGQLYAFLAKDFNDYSLDNEAIGTGNGTVKVFQSVKSYFFGGQTFVRLITKPVSGLIVKVNGVVTAVTVNLMTGQITFASAPPPASLITISGEFRVPVRFNSDSLSLAIGSKFQQGDFAMNGSVDLIEVAE